MPKKLDILEPLGIELLTSHLDLEAIEHFKPVIVLSIDSVLFNQFKSFAGMLYRYDFTIQALII